jgi:hypothetical protein
MMLDPTQLREQSGCKIFGLAVACRQGIHAALGELSDFDSL